MMNYGYGWRRKLLERERRKRERKQPAPRRSFQRVSAELQVIETRFVIQGRVFLHDLSPDGIGLFTDQPIERGEQVALVIDHPRALYVVGEVVWCSLYTMNTRVISTEAMKYRIGIRFLFETPEEKAALETYCKELG